MHLTPGDAATIRFGIAASWVSRLALVLQAVLILPLLYRHRHAEDITLWLLMSQGILMLALLELGIVPTATRAIAMALGRSRTAISGGSTVGFSADDVIATVRFWTSRISWIMPAALFMAGLPYLGMLHFAGHAFRDLLLYHAMLCTGLGLAMRGAWAHATIMGSGRVGWYETGNAVFTLLALGAQSALILFGLPFWSICLVCSLQAALARTLVVIAARKLLGDHPLPAPRRCQPVERSLAKPALRLWGTLVGAFFILKSAEFILAALVGPAAVPDYSATWQCLYAAVALSASVAQVHSPFISRSWADGDIAAAQLRTRAAFTTGFTCMSSGLGGLLACAPIFFQWWLGPGHFIGWPILMLLAACALLECSHVIMATCSRATDDEVYLPWALGAGALNIALLFLLVPAFGLLGAAMSVFAAQACTNNWYCVFRSCWRLRISLRDWLGWMLRGLLAGTGAFGLASLLASAAIRLGYGPPLALLGLAGAASLSAMAISLRQGRVRIPKAP